MSLLDIPVFELRFPRDAQEKGGALCIKVDVTGDVSLELPVTKEALAEAEHDFSVFWSGNEKRKLLELVRDLFEHWKNPFLLLTEWSRFKELFQDEFNATLATWTGALREFFEDPFLCFKKQIPLQDFAFLEVLTKFRDSSRNCLSTRIDLKGDFAHLIDPEVVGRHDIFGFHIKGIELAIFLKTLLRDFLLSIIKKWVVLL